MKCRPLPSYTTGEDDISLTDLFMPDLRWKCVDIIIDGPQLMVEKAFGFIAHVMAIAPDCTGSHCIIHCQAFALKKIPNPLKTVLDKLVKMFLMVL
jgi:hypothetical protein